MEMKLVWYVYEKNEKPLLAIIVNALLRLSLTSARQLHNLKSKVKITLQPVLIYPAPDNKSGKK